MFDCFNKYILENCWSSIHMIYDNEFKKILRNQRNTYYNLYCNLKSSARLLYYNDFSKKFNDNLTNS